MRSQGSPEHIGNFSVDQGQEKLTEEERRDLLAEFVLQPKLFTEEEQQPTLFEDEL